MPSWAGQRPRLRQAISGKEFLVLATMERQSSGAGSGPEERGRHGNGPGSGQRFVLTNGRRSRLPEDGPRARPRKKLGMSGPADLPFNGNAVLDRLDDRGGPQQPEMDGRSQRAGSQSPGTLGGFPKELSQSRHLEGAALSRTPLERRLGDGSLSAQRLGPLALLAAQSGSRASQTILLGLSRVRPTASRISRKCQRRPELRQRRDLVLDDGRGRIGDQRQQRPRPLA